jgi:hypothetical protein
MNFLKKMKIITEGQIPKKPLPQWVGMTLTCSFCKTVFELEEDDQPMVSSKRAGLFKTFAILSVQCPFCMAFVSKEYEIKE